MKIEKRFDFLAYFRDKEIDLNNLSPQAQRALEREGVSIEDLRALDFDGNGKITNEQEVKALFGLINRFDTETPDKTWTIIAQDDRGNLTRAGRLHNILSLQFEDPTAPISHQGQAVVPPHHMMRRSDFVQHFAGREFDLSRLTEQDKSFLWSAGEATAYGLSQADLNGDGKISTRDEYLALYDYLNRFDPDGRQATLTTHDANGHLTNAGKILQVIDHYASGAPVHHASGPGRVSAHGDRATAQTAPERLAGYFNHLLRNDNRLVADEINPQVIDQLVGREVLSVGDLAGLYKHFRSRCPTDRDKVALWDFLSHHVTVMPGSEDARQLAALRLDAISGDGRIQGFELQRAEVALMSVGMSREQAVHLLTTNLGAHLFPKMDVSAIQYIQSGWGSMKGQVHFFEKLMAERVQKAALVDSNFNGKLDAGDYRITFHPNGRIKEIRKVGDALSKDVLISKAIIDAAYEMARYERHFPNVGQNQQANPRYFTVQEGPNGLNVFQLRPGVKASDAMNDIINNPDAYTFECATAMVITQYRALQKLIGDEDFNRICSDLRIGAWVTEDHLKSITQIFKGDAANRLLTGDYGYVKNWDVSRQGAIEGWQGENIINLGNGFFYGHPFGVESAENIIAYLNNHRNEGSQRSASVLRQRSTLDRKLFDWDLNPND